MWPRTWLMAGPTADVAKVGDWFTFEIGRSRSRGPLRGPDRRLPQHPPWGYRSARPSAVTGSLRLPLPLWAYDLQEAARRRPGGLSAGSGRPDAPCLGRHLGAWPREPGPGGEPLADFLGVAGEHLEPYHFDRNYALTEHITFGGPATGRSGSTRPRGPFRGSSRAAARDQRRRRVRSTSSTTQPLPLKSAIQAALDGPEGAGCGLRSWSGDRRWPAPEAFARSRPTRGGPTSSPS